MLASVRCSRARPVLTFTLYRADLSLPSAHCCRMQSTSIDGAKDIASTFDVAITADDTLVCVAEYLEDACLLAFMLTCMVLRARLIGNDDFWQLRLCDALRKIISNITIAGKMSIN